MADLPMRYQTNYAWQGTGAYRSSAYGKLELEREDRGGYKFKRILIRPELTVGGESESLAGRVLEKAHRSCLVARSLNCPVDQEPTIHLQKPGSAAPQASSGTGPGSA